MEDLKEGQSVVSFAPSTMETMDFAVFEFFRDKFQLHCNTNKGWKRVPIIWASKERVAQVGDDGKVRDINRSLIYPLISIRRVALGKNERSKGKYYGNIFPEKDYKGGSITIARFINQDKTSNFANNDAAKNTGQINFPRKNEKVVYEWITIPQPSYIELSYEISIRTEYQQQMNEILQAILVKTGGIRAQRFEKDGHSYRGIFEEDIDIGDNSDDFGEEPRKYESKIKLRLYGYLIGSENEEFPRIVKRQNAVEVKISRERAILGDIPEHTYHGKYRR